MGCTIFVNGWCNYHCSLLTMVTLLLRVGCTSYCSLMAISQQSPPLTFIWTIILLLLQHKLASCSSSKLTILRASSKHTFSHTKGSLQPDGLPLHIWRVLTLVSGTTFPFEHINHARSEMIHQASHQGLQHPLKQKFPFPSAIVIIWVSQYDHELTTLPRVYSSRSCVCPLFHPRNHALLLRESLALSPKSPGSSLSLTMGAAH
jgi:hypothetical protein